MRIAVSYENGNVSGQFVQTESFKLYDIVSNEVVFSQTVSPSGKGHNALAGFLADQLVTCLICGGIGPDGQAALEDWGIQLYAGCSGNADQKVAELLAGTLTATTARSQHHL